MGDERAETHLRLLAEVELRRPGDQLRGLDAAAGTDDWSDPGMAPFATAEGAHWKVIRTGRILVAVGALDEDVLARFATDLHAAVKVRSRILLNWDRRRGVLHRTMFFGPSSRQALPPHHALRMYWPPDRSSTDLEITGAGPHHLPYDQLWAVDDQGTRYAVRFEGGTGGTATWRGIARLSPVPPRSARRLDLLGDGTRLIRLPLGPPAARSRRAVPSATEPAAIPPGERLLVLKAERILASGDARGPVQGPVPGEIITVLTEAGAIAADSSVHGQLAAPVPVDGPDVFAPLAGVLPDLDGARFALAGLSTTASESHLHVVGSGMPQLTDRFAHNWKPGFSWWLRDGAGNWHVAAAGEPCTSWNGTQAFRLRLTPPLAAVPDAAEVVVTGPATRVRATVPIRPAPGTSED